MPAARPQQKNAQQFDFYKYLRVIWRRKWFLIIPLAVCLPAAILAAYWYPTEYESQATLELQDNRPIAEEVPQIFNVGHAIMAVKTRALSWNSIREIVLSRKVDFGREIDPDDRRQLERVYHEVIRRTVVSALGGRHVMVSHRSTSPEKNASLVNEIIKKFVGEDTREAQDRAKTDLKYYRDKLASAKTQLSEVDGQIREFNQQHPWLTETLAEIHQKYKDAEDEEGAIKRQTLEVESSIQDLRKDLAKEKPEVVEKRQTELPADYVAAVREFEQARRYFEQVDKVFTRNHRKWQEARAMADQAKAATEKFGKVEPETIEETKPNPKHERIKSRIEQFEKELKILEARRLEATKKVSEWYVNQRKAPELLAERRALEEQRTNFGTIAKEYESGVRAAEKELNRLLTVAYSSKFKVVEYARDDRRPVQSTQMKIVLLGLMLGLLTGAGLVGLAEYLDQTFKTIDDARDFLGIPALGVIPAIFTPRDHRRKLWFRVLAVSSAVFVVGLAIAIYLAVPEAKEYLNMAWLRFQEWMEYW
jgi:capsular polysaccharide biosynthesis protein